MKGLLCDGLLLLLYWGSRLEPPLLIRRTERGFVASEGEIFFVLALELKISRAGFPNFSARMEISFQLKKEKLLGEISSPSPPARNPRSLDFVSPSHLRTLSLLLDLIDRTR